MGGRREELQMASGKTTLLQDIPALDLAYAVERLVAAGKTTKNEVLRLASERSDRIRVLEAELASLKSGAGTNGKAAARTAATTAGGVRVLMRKDGRRFTRTAKVAVARKLQGQYLGRLRQVPKSEKDKFKKIANEQGVAAAVAALNKRLGGK